MSERLFLTVEQAKAVLNDGDRIHTFRGGIPCLIGADWDREQLYKAFDAHKETIELTGSMARGMKHGICLFDDHGPLYIETNEERLAALEAELTTAPIT